MVTFLDVFVDFQQNYPQQSTLVERWEPVWAWTIYLWFKDGTRWKYNYQSKKLEQTFEPFPTEVEEKPTSGIILPTRYK